MSRICRVSLFVVAVVSLLSAVHPAAAQSVDECQAIIADLRTTTEGSTFANPDKDLPGLLGKLDSASTKLDAGKAADSEQALTQFRDKVVTLNSQGKIAPDDAAALTDQANEAIACVHSLTTP